VELAARVLEAISADLLVEKLLAVLNKEVDVRRTNHDCVAFVGRSYVVVSPRYATRNAIDVAQELDDGSSGRLCPGVMAS